MTDGATTSSATSEPELEYYFPHEEADLPFTLPSEGSGAGEVKVYKKGSATGPLWKKKALEECLAGEGKKSGTFVLDGLHEPAFEDSPLFVVFPSGVESEPKTPPPPADEGKKKSFADRVKAKGKVGINFGKDKLTVALSGEGGVGGGATGGAGASYVAGATGGQGGTGTGSGKPYSVTPVFEVEALLKSDETIVIFIRFLFRYLYHWCDALNFAIKFFKDEIEKGQQAGGGWQRPPGESAGTAFLGFNWWLGVFSVFAFKDALYDLVNDHADWVASILQKIGIEFKLDLNAAANIDVWAGANANATISGKCYIPLSVVLAPIIEFLMAGSNPPPGGGLADKIIPRIEAILEERIVIQLGLMPVGLELESQATLAKGTFEVPKGSPLRERIEKFGHDLVHAADRYKNQGLRKVPDELKLPRLILLLLDAETRNFLRLMKAGKKFAAAAGSAASTAGSALGDAQVNQAEIDQTSDAMGDVGDAGTEGVDALSATFETAGPFVKQIMDVLQGKAKDEPRGFGEEAQRLCALLRDTKVHGVQLGPKPPYEIAPVLSSDGACEGYSVQMYVEDDEKPLLPDKPAQPLLETAILKVALPKAPQTIGWDSYHDFDDDLDYTGIIVGFDSVSHDDEFRGGRDGAWVAEPLRSLAWEREGRTWTWCETGLAPYVAGRNLPMPEIALDGTGQHLLVTFDELGIGTITDDIKAQVPLFRTAEITRKTIWKVTLTARATRDEIDEIKYLIERNQPTDNPYDTRLFDEAMDATSPYAGTSGTSSPSTAASSATGGGASGSSSGSSSGAGDERAKRFGRLGRNYHPWVSWRARKEGGKGLAFKGRVPPRSGKPGKGGKDDKAGKGDKGGKPEVAGPGSPSQTQAAKPAGGLFTSLNLGTIAMPQASPPAQLPPSAPPPSGPQLKPPF